MPPFEYLVQDQLRDALVKVRDLKSANAALAKENRQLKAYRDSVESNLHESNSVRQYANRKMQETT